VANPLSESDDIAWLKSRALAAEAQVKRQAAGMRDMQATLRQMETELRRVQQGVPHDEWITGVELLRDALKSMQTGWRGRITRWLHGDKAADAADYATFLVNAISAERDGSTSAPSRRAAAEALARYGGLGIG
jgi:hypothetical protein